MICPVCEKAGINDDAAHCPQCNSDLSQLHLLTQLENKFRHAKRTNTIVFLCFSILMIALGIIFYVKNNNGKYIPPTNISKANSDSTIFYREKYFLASQTIDSLKKISEPMETVLKYKVKRGDNLSKIALMFYGDVTKVNKIASDNNLKNLNLINQNQILEIKISK